MASFVLSFFPLDALNGIWDLIESVSEGFLTYSLVIKQTSALVLTNKIRISLRIPAVRILCVCIINLRILRT